jgi:hypothetical protein
MIVAMFRTYLKPQANLDDLGVLHQKMRVLPVSAVDFRLAPLF